MEGWSSFECYDAPNKMLLSTRFMHGNILRAQYRIYGALLNREYCRILNNLWDIKTNTKYYNKYVYEEYTTLFMYSEKINWKFVINLYWLWKLCILYFVENCRNIIQILLICCFELQIYLYYNNIQGDTANST